jgi:hypothetical protein
MKKIIITINNELPPEVSEPLADALAATLEGMKLQGRIEIDGDAIIFPISTLLLTYIGTLEEGAPNVRPDRRPYTGRS